MTIGMSIKKLGMTDMRVLGNEKLVTHVSDLRRLAIPPPLNSRLSMFRDESFVGFRRNRKEIPPFPAR